jgi:hypothetical protein
MGGPESGQQFWQGGTAPGGRPILYAHWASGEPKDFSGEAFALIAPDGTWNDATDATVDDTREYVVEVSIVQDVDSIIPASFLLANDTDADDSNLSINSVSALSARGGTVVLLANGNIQYRGPAGFSGEDSFTYTVRDENGAISNAATVSFNVAPATNDNIDILATQWAAVNSIDLGGGTNTLDVWANGDISALGTPTVTNVATGNLTGFSDGSGKLTKFT